MLYSLILVSTMLVSSFGFTNIPTVSFTRNFDNKLDDISVIEPFFKTKDNSPCILFFTGGNSLMIPNIYHNFFNKLAHNNIAIYTPSFNYNNIDKLINQLNSEYSEIILAGHSSGCTTALNNNNKCIKKIIMFDPVDTRFFYKNKRDVPHKIKNIESILFVNAGKAYKFTDNPPGFPFIPFFSLKDDALETNKHCKMFRIEANEYGHCDILDKPYSNLMHNFRLAVGFHQRTHDASENYHLWLSDICNNFIKKKYKNLNYLRNYINENN